MARSLWRLNHLLRKLLLVRQQHNDTCASTLGTTQYVVAAAPSTSATIIDAQEWTTTQNISPLKDVSII